MSGAYSLGAVDEEEQDDRRLPASTSRSVAIGAYLVAGVIWVIAGFTAVSEFSDYEAVGVWTVLAIYLGVAALFVGAAARVHYRDR